MEQRIGDQAHLRRAISIDDFQDSDILAVSSTSQDYGVAQKIASAAKKDNPKIITVLGGHHVSYLPESMSEQFDIGVIGEGEETFSVLVRAILNGADIGRIPGLAFHHEGRVILTPPRGYINPIDTIPMPYRDYYRNVYLMSSRGCPYSCSFCTSKVFWGKTRFFSAPYVVAEIEHLVSNMGENPFINIYDDLFVADRKRFDEIICLLEKKGLTDTVSFGFSVRANMVDETLCGQIRRFRKVDVCFGAESGSDRILKLMNKGSTVAVNQRALDLLHQYQIPAACSFIVGWPTETEEEIRSTYEFVNRNSLEGKHPAAAVVNILMPMPGTAVWNHAIASGIIPKLGFDWDRLGIFASYHHSTAKSFEDWVCSRRENNSIYMNEDTVPQERLYQIMSEYEQARA
jgi:radical SAM superfamily enzyme YgiQ (UPF0313 family)